MTTIKKLVTCSIIFISSCGPKMYLLENLDVYCYDNLSYYRFPGGYIVNALDSNGKPIGCNYGH